MLRLINICSVFVFFFNLSKFFIKNVDGSTEESPLLKHGDLIERKW